MRHAVEPAVHVLLSDSGVRKRKGVDFDAEEAVAVLAEVRASFRRDLVLWEPPSQALERQGR